MNNTENKLLFLFGKFFQKGKIKFLKDGVMVVEDKLESLLPLIEELEKQEISLKDNLNTFYLRKGNILSKPVRLCMIRKRAYLFPGGN